ncbi:hypothetical protein RRG08_048732 [Elysia crispata]|uniref:Uncharacterized protein n=1 Tax=Elysia crispata TaxID=231223 RepID=A0AAE1D773_9GAST|nr:hypothetical protein RRG08_048732 [Elysia crispata]
MFVTLKDKRVNFKLRPSIETFVNSLRLFSLTEVVEVVEVQVESLEKVSNVTLTVRVKAKRFAFMISVNTYVTSAASFETHSADVADNFNELV